MAALKPGELVHVRGERSLDVGRREHRERFGQLHGHAPVVHDEAVGLLVAGGAVHPGDGLEQRVLPERRVEIHDLLDRRVETGEQHVADDEDGQRVVRVLEALDQLVLLLLAQVPAGQALLVVVARGHDEGRLGGRSGDPALPCR